MIETNAADSADLIEPLIRGLSDTNQYVVSAMAAALSKIKGDQRSAGDGDESRSVAESADSQAAGFAEGKRSVCAIFP